MKCAQGGALATETKLETIYLGGTVNMVPNSTLDEVAGKHLRKFCDLKFDDAEKQFALRLQETLQDRPPLEQVGEVVAPGGGISTGSTDVSDVSWVVPTGGFAASCWVPGTPAHSWQATAAGGMSIGKKGMHLAAKVLAATAWDLFQDGKLIAAARTEHQQRLAGRTYQALILPAQAPPLDYRDPPRKMFAPD